MASAMLFDYLPADWRAFVELDRFRDLERTIDRLYAEKGPRILPPRDRVFHAFDCCPLATLKVIVVGQDPYHTPGQANGLAFSCETEGVIQPSLANILAEVVRSVGEPLRTRRVERGNLEPWAEQGVLLLNTVLTVEAGRARSHIGQGWEEFTGYILYRLLATRQHLVVMQWGKDAAAVPLPPQAHRNHLILTASHPSPLSYRLSFQGCDHFQRCNAYLLQHHQTSIQWT